LDNLYRLLRTSRDASSLGPEEIRVVAAAYDAAVTDLDVRPDDIATRETLASHIIEGALLGERDPARLRERALAHVRPKPSPAGRGAC
jgi:hypothetical protein